MLEILRRRNIVLVVYAILCCVRIAGMTLLSPRVAFYAKVEL